jgi:glutamyl-tRNA synthetase
MGITHVLRGDDHVNNTPKQILLYQALGARLPLFGHVPMILGPDRQKLSKRHGAKAVIEYEKDGLLPEALLNYLVRLGWSRGDQEIFSRQELLASFDGTSLNGAASAFDPEKLLWVNARHLRAALPEQLFPPLVPFLAQAGLPAEDGALVKRCIPLVQPRAASLKDMVEKLRPLLVSPAALAHNAAAGARICTGEGRTHVAALRDRLAALPGFSREEVRDCIHAYVEEAGVSFKAVGPPLRVSLFGATGGPDLAEAMAVIGKENTLARLNCALAMPGR